MVDKKKKKKKNSKQEENTILNNKQINITTLYILSKETATFVENISCRIKLDLKRK